MQFQQLQLLAWIWERKEDEVGVPPHRCGQAKTAHRADSCVVWFIEIAADLEGQLAVITGALSGTTWFALGKRLPHILSLLQETKDAESSRKCSFIPPSRLRQVGVSKKGVTRGLFVAWTASQAPESSKCAQGDTSTSTLFCSDICFYVFELLTVLFLNFFHFVNFICDFPIFSLLFSTFYFHVFIFPFSPVF